MSKEVNFRFVVDMTRFVAAVQMLVRYLDPEYYEAIDSWESEGGAL